MLNKRDSFSGKFGVIAAAAGSAIGLGNIWKFPYILGENGGAAFLILYLFFIFAIGIPVMLSEFSLGRMTQRNPFGAFKILAPKRPWYLIGLMGVVAAFLILAFYGTVAGWTLGYLYKSVMNEFSGKNPVELTELFNDFRTDKYQPIFWHVVFMILTSWIVISGVKNGIEKYSKILMPLLLVIVIILDIRAISLPNGTEGLKFLFSPDFSKITANTVLDALGQAFFSLSIGMGVLLTYGSYINKKENLIKTAVTVSIADTMIAILAGIAIFPAVYAFNIDPASGPGLVFQTLPNIFQQMTGGNMFGIMFFILLVVAALTSSISLLEVVVAYFIEELKLTRKISTIIATISIGFLGLFCTLSVGPLADEMAVFGKSLFDIFDFTASNVMLPLGGLLIIVFTGWFLSRKKFFNELSNAGILKVKLFKIMMIIIKFVAPFAIAAVLIKSAFFSTGTDNSSEEENIKTEQVEVK